MANETYKTIGEVFQDHNIVLTPRNSRRNGDTIEIQSIEDGVVNATDGKGKVLTGQYKAFSPSSGSMSLSYKVDEDSKLESPQYSFAMGRRRSPFKDFSIFGNLTGRNGYDFLAELKPKEGVKPKRLDTLRFNRV